MRIAGLLFLMSLCGPFLALATSPAREDSAILLVLHAPWRNGAELVEGAGGQVVGPFATPVGVLAVARQPNFETRVRSLGGRLFDGERLAELCGVST